MTRIQYYLVILLYLSWEMAGPAQAEGVEDCCLIDTSEVCNTTCVELQMMTTARNSTALTSTELQALSSSCIPYYTTFWSCIDDTITEIVTGAPPTEEAITTTPMSRHKKCCEESLDGACRNSCSAIFSGVHDGDDLSDVISMLIEPCGPPPDGPLWHCLFEGATSTPPPTTILPVTQYADWARIQCCYEALDERCRASCIELYSGTVSSGAWATFQLDCIHRPIEKSVSTCLADVTSPCKLGCSGMQFCINFNNRPFQSFRQCNTVADRSAKNSYYSWIRSGRIAHPLVTLFVNMIDQCLPDLWKAVSCVTHLQPCHTTTHATQICRVDCLKLLRKCSRFPNSATRICNIIAPESTESHCIALGQYLESSPFGNDIISPVSTSIDNPCDPNPCTAGFFCNINRLCDSGDVRCTGYECQPGCVLGAKPGITLPRGSVVRVSLISNSTSRCFGYFNCSSSFDTNALLSPGRPSANRLAEVNRPTMGPCEVETTCITENGDIYGHRSRFWMDCNFCFCHYGRITCTQRSCAANHSGSSFDCNCSTEYDPICTRTGVTIRNPCSAQCLGHAPSDYHLGDCGSPKPCSSFGNNNCDRISKCIPLRHSCLSNNAMHTHCRQYTCESLHQGSCGKKTSPVCDTFNKQHNNLCSLLGTHDEFNYLGYCKEECGEQSSSVCGVNGETFASRCHAHTMHVYVDYYGKCSATPRPGFDGENTCQHVKCPALEIPGCRAVIPYGACCPHCGSVVTILKDRKILGDNLHYLGQEYLSSSDVVQSLLNHINYIQCQMYGYISEDGSLIMMVVPDKDFANRDILSEVCHQEAIKVATLINNQAPVMMSDVFLSHLVAAHVNNVTVTTPLPTFVPYSGGATNDSTHVSLSSCTLWTSFMLLIIARLLDSTSMNCT